MELKITEILEPPNETEGWTFQGKTYYTGGEYKQIEYRELQKALSSNNFTSLQILDMIFYIHTIVGNKNYIQDAGGGAYEVSDVKLGKAVLNAKVLVKQKHDEKFNAKFEDTIND